MPAAHTCTMAHVHTFSILCASALHIFLILTPFCCGYAEPRFRLTPQSQRQGGLHGVPLICLCFTPYLAATCTIVLLTWATHAGSLRVRYQHIMIISCWGTPHSLYLYTRRHWHVVGGTKPTQLRYSLGLNLLEAAVVRGCCNNCVQLQSGLAATAKMYNQED